MGSRKSKSAETETELAVGDVVALRGGGPCMTVESVTDGHVCTCWFSEDDEHTGPYRDSFPGECLMLLTRREEACRAADGEVSNG